LDLMGTVIRAPGVALTMLPVGLPHDGNTAGLAFEMYYPMGNFVPLREPAWSLLHERGALLGEKCIAASRQEGAPSPVSDAARGTESITAKLAAHVPSEMLTPQAPRDPPPADRQPFSTGDGSVGEGRVGRGRALWRPRTRAAAARLPRGSRPEWPSYRSTR